MSLVSVILISILVAALSVVFLKNKLTLALVNFLVLFAVGLVFYQLKANYALILLVVMGFPNLVYTTIVIIIYSERPYGLIGTYSLKKYLIITIASILILSIYLQNSGIDHQMKLGVISNFNYMSYTNILFGKFGILISLIGLALFSITVCLVSKDKK